MRLSHLHLSNPIPYIHSLRLQEAALERHFAYNSSLLQLRSSPSTPSSVSPPPPTLLTFQTNPTYTVGRRHLKSNPLSDSQIQFLTTDNLASFHASPRGGLLTYHGPGQITAYLIYNLRHHSITPRCHVRLLEESVIKTARTYSIESKTTDDPGVWVTSPNGEASDRKLCAIGVHVTRGITNHGVGLNVFNHRIDDEELKDMYKQPVVRAGEERMKESNKPADGYLSWGFSRIVACGLEGKRVTWMTQEGARDDLSLKGVADTLAVEMCKGLSEKGKIEVDGVDQIEQSDILEPGSIDMLTGEKVQGMKGGLDDWVDMLKGGKMVIDHALKR